MIAGGDGSVITGRFVTRQVDVIARVEILGADSSIEVLEGTTIHPIWSVDRSNWVLLGDLVEGERLQSDDGIAMVVSVRILRDTRPVYNIEVHGEHVYQVGILTLLVHNANPLDCLGWVQRSTRQGERLVMDAVDGVIGGFPGAYNGASVYWHAFIPAL